MSRQATPSSPVKRGTKKLTPEQQTIRDRVAQLIPNWATVEVEEFCAKAGWDVQEVQSRLAARQEENPAHLCETEAWTDAPKRKQKDESARKRGRGRGRGGGGREGRPRTKSEVGDKDGEKERREPKEFSARGRGRGGRRGEKTRKPEQTAAETDIKKEVKPDPFAGRSFASLLKPAPVPVPEVVAPAQPAEKPRRWTKLTKKNGSVLFSKAARGVTEEVKPVEEQKVDVVQAVAVEVEVVQPVRVEKQEEVPVVEASRIAPLPAAPVAARPPKIVSQLLTAPSAVMLPSTIGPQEVTISFGSFGVSTPPTSPRKQAAASPEETSVSLDGYGGLDMALSRENAVAMATSVLSSPDSVLLPQAIQAPATSQLSPKQNPKLEPEETHETPHPPLQHQYFNQPPQASQSGEAAYRTPFPPENAHAYDLNAQRQGFAEPYMYDSTYFNQGVPPARRGNAPQYRGTVARANPKGKMDGAKDTTQLQGTPPKQSPTLQSSQQSSQQYNLPYGQQQQQQQQQPQQQQPQQQQQQQRPQGQFSNQQQYPQQSFKQGPDRRAPNNFNKQHQAGAYPMNVPYGSPYMFPYMNQYYGQPVPQFPPGFQQRGAPYYAPYGYEFDYNRGYGQEVGGMNPNEEETLNSYEGSNKPQSQAGTESTSQASAGQKPKVQGTQFAGQAPYPQSFPPMAPNFQSGDRYNWTGQ